MSKAKLGTFDDLMAITEAAMQPIAIALRALVMEIDPETTEVVRLGDRAATYGLGPKKMSEGYCYVLPYKKHVNFGFYKGATLPDPEGRMQGTGANMRHVKVKSVDDIDDALRDFVLAAIAERKQALGR